MSKSFGMVSLLISVAVVDPSIAVEQFFLTAPGGAANDRFSWYANLDSGTAVVSSLMEGPSPSPGAAYVFDIPGSAAPLTVTPGDAGVSNFYGFSTDVRGNIAIVSDPGDPADVLPDAGAVYTYDITTGDELQRIQPTAPVPGAEFGFSVAMDDGRLVAGAPGGGTGVGSAFVMDVDTGAQLVELVPAAMDRFSGNEFGYSVDLDGATAVVGSPVNVNSSVSRQRAGQAHVFDVTDGTLRFSLEAPDAEPRDEFGWSVAMDREHIIVGAPYRGVFDGRAYIFDRETGDFQHALTPPVDEAGNDYGYSVAILGDFAVVGAPAGGDVANRAYLYDVASGNLVRELDRSSGATDDEFGFTVAISDTAVLVGAPLMDIDGSPDVGGAYVYCLVNGDTDCDGFAQVDFNRDRNIDGQDIDELVAEIVAGNNDAAFDLNDDTLVNHDDLHRWLTDAGALTLESGNPYLPGDADLDGVVEDEDHETLNANLFTFNPAWTLGDFNADGGIDGVDFNIWNAHKHMSALVSGAAVPEPSSGLLGWLACAGLWARARRKTAGRRLRDNRNTPC